MSGTELVALILFLLNVVVWWKATSKKRVAKHTSKARRRGKESAYCTRVIDGDTIQVIVDGRLERVRYIGMDTPEVGESGYKSATEANRHLVVGRTITMQRDKTDRDKYGRLLRYVWVGKTFVNAKLVRMGKATVMVVAPNVRRIQEIAG